jgi:hypothetical protein
MAKGGLFVEEGGVHVNFGGVKSNTALTVVAGDVSIVGTAHVRFGFHVSPWRCPRSRLRFLFLVVTSTVHGRDIHHRHGSFLHSR